jgi:hypothetical protein
VSESLSTRRAAAAATFCCDQNDDGHCLEEMTGGEAPADKPKVDRFDSTTHCWSSNGTRID